MAAPRRRSSWSAIERGHGAAASSAIARLAARRREAAPRPPASRRSSAAPGAGTARTPRSCIRRRRGVGVEHLPATPALRRPGRLGGRLGSAASSSSSGERQAARKRSRSVSTSASSPSRALTRSAQSAARALVLAGGELAEAVAELDLLLLQLRLVAGPLQLAAQRLQLGELAARALLERPRLLLEGVEARAVVAAHALEDHLGDALAALGHQPQAILEHLLVAPDAASAPRSRRCRSPGSGRAWRPPCGGRGGILSPGNPRRPPAHPSRASPGGRSLVTISPMLNRLIAPSCCPAGDGPRLPRLAPATRSRRRRTAAEPLRPHRRRGSARDRLGARRPAPASTPRRRPPWPPPACPGCANDELLAYDGLLVLAPHPDDESLGFGGLAATYRGQGKPVTVLVVTDGDAYCEACRLWKSSSVRGATCDGARAVQPRDAGGRQLRRGAARRERRRRRRARARRADLPRLPRRRARRGLEQPREPASSQTAAAPLRLLALHATARPARAATAKVRRPSSPRPRSTTTLRERIAATSPHTLLATTHWLDGHGDHAALGQLVRADRRASCRSRAPLAYAVIHAHTPKDTSHPDCWYPAPRALACPCAAERGVRHRRHLMGRASGAPPLPPRLAGRPPRRRRLRRGAPALPLAGAVAGRVGQEARRRALLRLAARHARRARQPSAPGSR